MPQKNERATISDVQPGTTLEVKYATYIAKQIQTKHKKLTKSPKARANRSGRNENDVMPSKEKLNIFQNGYFVSPAYLARLSYSIPVCLYPTHETSPRRKRFRSLNCF